MPDGLGDGDRKTGKCALKARGKVIGDHAGIGDFDGKDLDLPRHGNPEQATQFQGVAQTEAMGSPVLKDRKFAGVEVVEVAGGEAVGDDGIDDPDVIKAGEFVQKTQSGLGRLADDAEFGGAEAIADVSNQSEADPVVPQQVIAHAEEQRVPWGARVVRGRSAGGRRWCDCHGHDCSSSRTRVRVWS